MNGKPVWCISLLLACTTSSFLLTWIVDGRHLDYQQPTLLKERKAVIRQDSKKKGWSEEDLRWILPKIGVTTVRPYWSWAAKGFYACSSYSLYMVFVFTYIPTADSPEAGDLNSESTRNVVVLVQGCRRDSTDSHRDESPNVSDWHERGKRTFPSINIKQQTIFCAACKWIWPDQKIARYRFLQEKRIHRNTINSSTPIVSVVVPILFLFWITLPFPFPLFVIR